MNKLNSEMYNSYSKSELNQIKGGGKTLSWIECIGQYDENGNLIATETIRHYDNEFLGIKWKTEKPDKDGDVGNC